MKKIMILQSGMLLFLIFCFISSQELKPFLEFKFINISFPTPQQSFEYISKQHYRNITMNGIKIDNEGNIYVSLPRWKLNVPITLALYNPQTKLFEGFPSWEMNNNPNTSENINSVLGFEIDRKNRMWILDQSHINGQTPAPENSTKLIIYDLTNKKIEYIHHFSDTIAPRKTSFLNDLVLDPLKEIAYISDSGISDGNNFDPAIIIFDYPSKTSKRVLSGHSIFVMPNTSLSFKTDGIKCRTNGNMNTGVDGIALTCDYKRLYFCPLTSHNIYGIETSILLTSKTPETSVFQIGNKNTVSDGLVLGSKGSMYFGNIEKNGILKSKDSEMLKILTSKKNNYGPLPSMKEFVKSQKDMIWQDTLSIGPDKVGGKEYFLWWTTNNLCNWLNGLLDYKDVNYRIWKTEIDEKPYVEGCYVPPTPHHDDNNPDDDGKNLELWKIFVIIGCCIMLFVCALIYIGCVIISGIVVYFTRKKVDDYDELM